MNCLDILIDNQGPKFKFLRLDLAWAFFIFLNYDSLKNKDSVISMSKLEALE